MPTGAPPLRTRAVRGIRSLAATVAVVAAGALALTGCAADQAAFEEAVPEAVLAADANIADTHLSFSSGLAGRGFWLRLYLDDTSVDAAADSVEAALEAAYRASPSEPTSITVDIAEAPAPVEVELTSGSLPIEEVADEAGLPWADNEIRLPAEALEARYGPWQENP
ncbi:hypothetical protein [Agromyces sp. PvR057]|uniref:hypothetical protein n=1 Tax=Agromyces sp. PvR057 TaxID=3156403 RepID=UPI003398B238